MMRPRLLLAAYHGEGLASGSGRVAKRQQALRARKAVGGVRSLEPSELLINAAVAEGIRSIATVHGSFGCLAAQAERFRRIIREQFVRLYEEK
jgi:DNA-directed RNA polymerase